MGLFSRTPDTIEVTEELVESIERPDDRHLLAIKPNNDGPGVEKAEQFVREFYSSNGDASRYSWEMWYEGGELRYVASAEDRDDVEDAIQSQYSRSSVRDVDGNGFLGLEEGDHVAARRVKQKLDCVYPTRSHYTHDPIEGDTYASLLPKVIGTERERALVQIVYSPVSKGWYGRGVFGKGGGKAARQKRKGHSEGEINPKIVQSEADEDAADDIVKQHGRPAFQVSLRVFAAAEDGETAETRVEKITDELNDHFEHIGGQEFVAETVKPGEIADEIHRATGREHMKHSRLRSALQGPRQVLTDRQLAELVHASREKEVDHQRVVYQTVDPGRGVPPGTARYDFRAAGVEHASRAEKALATIDHPEYGDDGLMLGFGTKNGTEAGVLDRLLNSHMQVTGATRMGKTTLGTNIASQVMKKGHGGIFIWTGKRGDDEELIAEWPDDRDEDDFIFVDTGDRFEKRTRLNLLRIDESLEPGSTEHTSYVNTLADDFCAAFAAAGDGELYPLMRGITRTVVRGMAKTDRVCTPIDLAAACSSAENMDEFSGWMDDERFYFLRRTAARFAQKEDADMEPIARRMDEIVQNGNLLTLLSARDPDFRIQEAVNDGKVIVLRIDPSLSDTGRAFATNPIVRRAAYAKKMAHKRGVNTDPFYCVWDEADKTANDHSNLGNILSEYGGYGFRCCLLYQAPSNQLPDQLRDETEAQIDTTISFRTTGKDARFIAHQHTIDKDSLSKLPRHTFYLNTDTKTDDPTGSIMVDAYPPIREMRAEVQDVEPMTDEEIEAMKRRAVERYGDVPETTDEMIEGSHFLEGESAAEADDETEDTKPAVVRPTVLQAVYDAAYREHGDGHAPIALDDATERIARYLEEVGVDLDDDPTASQVSTLLSEVPTDELRRDDRDGELYVECTSLGRMRFTSPDPPGEVGVDLDDVQENRGGEGHASLMRDAYDELLECDLRMNIHRQDGADMPDATAIPDLEEYRSLRSNPTLEPAEVASRVAEIRENHEMVARLSDARPISVEAESTKGTGGTAPAQTLVNLAAALEDGRRCLLLARGETAKAIRSRIEDAPALMRSTGEDDVVRLYNRNRDLQINGETIYRRSGGESKWLYHQRTGTFELVGRDGTIATFEAAEEILEDASAYPRTESEIADFDQWSTVKRPLVPSLAFDVEMGDAPDPAMYDVVRVPSGNDDGGLEIVERDGAIPLSELCEREDDRDHDRDRRDRSSGPLPEF